LCGQVGIWSTTHRERKPLRALLLTLLPPSKENLFSLREYITLLYMYGRVPQATTKVKGYLIFTK